MRFFFSFVLLSFVLGSCSSSDKVAERSTTAVEESVHVAAVDSTEQVNHSIDPAEEVPLIAEADSAKLAEKELILSNLGELQQRVNDRAQMMDDVIDTKLEKRLADFEQATSHQIVVLTLESIDGKDPLEYATSIGNAWGIGQKDKDNGVLLLIAKSERKMAIAVGLGLEETLTDSTCKNIIDEYIVPAFKEGSYDRGITSGCDRIMTLLTN